MITIKEASNTYNQWVVGKYAHLTARNYIIWTKRFITYIKPDTPIQDIQVEDFIGYLHHLKTKYKLQTSTQAYHMIALRIFWQYLYLNNYTKVSEKLIPIPKYQTQSHPPAYKEDVEKIIQSIKGEGDGLIQLRDQLIVAMLYTTGIRVSELCDLQMNDLELAQRYASIISKKNHLRRTILWDDRVEVLLLTYIEYRMEYAKCDYLFIALDRKSHGKKLTTRSVERMVKKHRDRLGITKKITPHSMRHGYGMDSTKSNRHPRYIQRSLGHRNITSSQIYMQVDDVELREEAKEFIEERKLDI